MIATRTVSLILAVVLLSACSEDVTGPPLDVPDLAFVGGGPTVEFASQTRLNVVANASRTADLFVIAQDTAVDAPTAEAIRAGLDGSGASATSASQTGVSGPTTLSLTDVPPYQSYAVYALLVSGDDEVVASAGATNPLTLAVDSAASFAHTRSLLVTVGGEIVEERYFNGSAVDSLQDVRSVTKGILALLVGQAIDQGLLDLSTTIGETFPPSYTAGLAPEKLGITVEHLLTMSSGLGWLESEFGPWTQLPDEVVAVLSRDLTSAPGTVFDYSTIDLQMLSVIFQESTGQTLHDFAKANLFAQLGIDESVWIGFETGYTLAGGFSFIRARDMVKIGQMVRDDGMYEGEQIVPSTWIAAMRSPKFTFPAYLTTGPDLVSQWFGYLWWEADIDGIDGYMTAGYGGQNILVVPSMDLVLTSSSVAQVNGATATQQQIDNWSVLAGVVRALRDSS